MKFGFRTGGREREQGDSYCVGCAAMLGEGYRSYPVQRVSDWLTPKTSGTQPRLFASVTCAALFLDGLVRVASKRS